MTNYYSWKWQDISNEESEGSYLYQISSELMWWYGPSEKTECPTSCWRNSPETWRAHVYLKYLDFGSSANSADSDGTAPEEQSHPSLHCLHKKMKQACLKKDHVHTPIHIQRRKSPLHE